MLSIAIKGLYCHDLLTMKPIMVYNEILLINADLLVVLKYYKEITNC